MNHPTKYLNKPMNNEKEKNVADVLDISSIFQLVREKKGLYLKVLPVVFTLSCIWIFPQPRFYTCELVLAPEGGENPINGIASVASRFGVDFGTSPADAIYPSLYPDLFESPEFIVGLFNINIKTYDGNIKCNYYSYLNKHQKKNPITQPLKSLKSHIVNIFKEKKQASKKDNTFNPFNLTEQEFNTAEEIKSNVKCSVDKKTDVISISVKDQDRLVCALLADSIRERLQKFIIEYRTSKARQDVIYYKHLTDSAKKAYEKAVHKFAAYSDGHRNIVMQTYKEESQRLQNEININLNTYNTLAAQLALARAKVQEKTPSFTTLKSATVPQRPSGPKRLAFVLGFLLLASIIVTIYIVKDLIIGKEQK